MIKPKDTDNLAWIGGAVRTLPSGSVYGLSVVRNEIDRIPYLLEYYRSIGVKQFLFISDHSTDGTTDLLLEQSDCAVFLPNTSFKESRCGVDWQNYLLNMYCNDSWVITFDADEIFTFPFAERLSLPELCRFLDDEGSNVVSSFLLDMYSSGPISSAIYQAPAPFLTTSFLFDKDYRFVPARKAVDYVPSGKVIGGPRARLFYRMQNKYSLLSRAIMYFLVNILQNHGITPSKRYHYVPTLLKAPLVRWIPGNKRNSNHNIVLGPKVKVSSVTSAVLHFKFFADFHQRATQEILRGQHYNGAQEYQRYVSYIEKNPDFRFSYSGSREFTGSADLVRLGLIKSTPELDAFVERLIS